MAKRKNSVPFQFKKNVIDMYNNSDLSGKECLDVCLGQWNETHDKKVVPSDSWFKYPHSILHGWKNTVKNGPKQSFDIVGNDGDETLIINGVKYIKEVKVVEMITKKKKVG